jgi:recombination protein RecR
MAELGKLPGIGARTAERLAFYLLKSTPQEAMALADAIRDVKQRVRPCKTCFNLAEGELCAVCADPRRDKSILCVVEQPKDVLALESTGAYRGVYHVLGGHIAPLEGSEAEDLTIEPLVRRVAAGGVKEVILATNPTVAGDGTALHITSLLTPKGVKITRLARGLPAGGQIEYAAKSILADAINERRPM